MIKKQPRILFFIKGAVPTVAEMEAAENCGNNVSFRNASLVPKVCNPEKCDGVEGVVPEAYKKLPLAGEVLKSFADKMKAEKEVEIERLKQQEEVNAKKQALAKEAAEKIAAAKAAKVEANKAVSEAKQEANKAQNIKWAAGK